MLYHHSDQDYEVAASEAATRARAKMEAQIETGKINAGKVIEQVMTEIPHDQIVRGAALRFESQQGRLVINAGTMHNPAHAHALGQLASRADLPLAYVRDLQETASKGSEGAWADDLLARNFTDLYHYGPASQKSYLVRSVAGEARGFLSDRFRRLDSRPIVEDFCEAVQALGAVPVEGYALPTKIAIKALLPLVFEPVPNEVLCFGVVLENSDFGNGALAVRGFMLRLRCTNFAISEDAIRKVHIGGRLDENIQYSQKTYELDTRAAASAARDVVAGLLGPGKVAESCALIQQAHEQQIGSREISAYLKKARLGVAEAKAVTDAFVSADVVNMPAGQSRYRLSNAISWVAGHTEDRERGLELMKLAGAALVGKTVAADMAEAA